MRTQLLKSMASGPRKIEKGTCPVLKLATHRHTTESAANCLHQGNPAKARSFLWKIPS